MFGFLLHFCRLIESHDFSRPINCYMPIEGVSETIVRLQIIQSKEIFQIILCVTSTKQTKNRTVSSQEC